MRTRIIGFEYLKILFLDCSFTKHRSVCVNTQLLAGSLTPATRLRTAVVVLVPAKDPGMSPDPQRPVIGPLVGKWGVPGCDADTGHWIVVKIGML